MGETEQIRVVIVDDHPSLRDGVRTDLEASGVAEVVGEASDGGEAIEVVRRSMPDAAIAATVADAVLPVEEIGKFLYGLCLAPAGIREGTTA